VEPADKCRILHDAPLWMGGTGFEPVTSTV
jgi:hypothetical protein